MGMVDDFDTFCSIRFLLGLFEAGHWPCALRLTQRTFLPQQRTFANGILQTGGSVAQVVTPLLIVALNRWDPTHWRLSCWVVRRRRHSLGASVAGVGAQFRCEPPGDRDR